MVPPSIINLFSSTWWGGIIISIIVGFVVIQIGMKIPPDKRRILMVVVGLSLITVKIWQQLYLHKLGLWRTSTSLPIHLCGISGLLAGLMMLKPKQIGFEFLALIGIAGAFQGLITPQLNHGENTYLIIEYYIIHSGIIIVPLFLTIVEGFRVRKKSWLRVFFICQLLIIFNLSINYLLDANYMYLTSPPLVNNPLIIGNWPWYVLVFEFLGLCHILILYYGFRRFQPLLF